MKKILLLIAALLAGYTYFNNPASTRPDQGASAELGQRAAQSDALIAHAFARQISNLQVSGQGVVSKILPDDNSGSRHQRFIVQLANGQTLLFAHNIDLAPRVDDLREGDSILFNGEYEWNAKGGVVHWTHRDPDGSHPAGWLQHQGKIYQ